MNLSLLLGEPICLLVFPILAVLQMLVGMLRNTGTRRQTYTSNKMTVMQRDCRIT